MEEIKKEFLDVKLNEYGLDRGNTILRHALSNTPLQTVVESKDFEEKVINEFDINIKTMKATNQKASGRCWIFSALNVLRESLAKKINVDEVELSQGYVAFFDKLEKINYELESIIELIGKEHDDRTLLCVLNNTIGDGGQWDMLVSVLNKYGICPKTCFQDSFNVSATAEMNRFISINLKKFAANVGEIYKNGGMEAVRIAKTRILEKMYSLLLSVYGIPPKEFDFEYTDKDGKYHKEHYTSLGFYEKYLKSEVNDYVSLINAPTKDKEYNKSYTIKYLGNVVGGKGVKHLNIPMERMIELIVNQLKDGRIVWFGSDVGFYRNRSVPYWDDNQYDYETAFSLSYKVEKDKALDYSMSAMNHAMCITGVAFEEGKPVRWKIENSWGTDTGNAGYFIMSDTWFNRYVYQAVVDKKYLSKEELKAYESEPVELKPWDPMGSLAD